MIIILLLVLVSSVSASTLCEDVIQTGTNCTYVTNCSTGYEIINMSGSLIESNNTYPFYDSLYYFNIDNYTEGFYIVGLCGEYDYIEVAETGENNMMIAIILLPLFFSLILLIGAATMNSEHNVLKIFLYMLSIIPFFGSMHFAAMSIIKFYSWTAMEEAIGTTVWWSGLMFFVMIVYFVIYLVYTLIEYIAQKKKARLEY